MAPAIYYTKSSPPSRAVLMVAKHIGLELEHKLVKISVGEHLQEAFAKINPQHTLPTVVDGDFTIWDSHAVSTYLIGKYAKNDSLYPKDLKVRSKIDQRLHFEGSVLFPAGAGYMVKKKKINLMFCGIFREIFILIIVFSWLCSEEVETSRNQK